MAVDESLLGSSVVLAVDGQKVTGKVTSVRSGAIEITLPVRQEADDLVGTDVRAELSDGTVIEATLERAYLANLVLELTLPSATPPPDDERRKFFRLGIQLDVEVLEQLEYQKGILKEFVRATGHTLNLSGGGMLVELDRALPSGTYDFRVQMPHEPLTLKGRAIRKAGSATPIEFVGMAERDRARLIRFIFNRLRGFPDEPAGNTASSAEDELPRHVLRRQRFFRPTKIRYW